MPSPVSAILTPNDSDQPSSIVTYPQLRSSPTRSAVRACVRALLDLHLSVVVCSECVDDSHSASLKPTCRVRVTYLLERCVCDVDRTAARYDVPPTFRRRSKVCQPHTCTVCLSVCHTA